MTNTAKLIVWSRSLVHLERRMTSYHIAERHSQREQCENITELQNKMVRCVQETCGPP